MMQLCSCGHVFAYPKTKYGEQLEHFGTPCRESYGVCPSCGGEDYDDALRCAGCARYVLFRQMEQGLCTACQKRVLRQLQNFLDEFTETERAFMLEALTHG
ncbi:MAG: hypothetical protein ACYCX2_02010 [Christensenellales bacterium]